MLKYLQKEMNTIIITPKNNQEFQFVNELLNKMKMNFKTLSEEEIEDIGLSVLLRSADRTRKVGRDKVMRSLKDNKSR